MVTWPLLLSLLFFFSFAVYIFCGFLIFILNVRPASKILFFLICLSLGTWALGFSIANSAPDYSSALFWYRVAALGWGTFYSFFLHFTLNITEKEPYPEKKWTYLLIYLPALINIYLFSLCDRFAVPRYNLSPTPLGWSIKPPLNIFEIYFNIMYISFSLLSVIQLAKWGGGKTDQDSKKASRLIILGMIIAFVVSTFIDTISSTYLSVRIPQMAPIIILIPFAAILYSIKKYGVMKPVEQSRQYPEGQFLNQAIRSTFYDYLSISYILGSFITVVSAYFFFHEPLSRVFPFAGLLFLWGVLIQFIKNIRIKDNTKDIITILLICMSLPFITLRYVHYASLTIWAFALIALMYIILFNKLWGILLLGLTITATQIWIWYKVPRLMVQIDSSDYFARIGLYFLGILVALYIYQVFNIRLKENERQNRRQQLLSQISQDFVTVNESNIGETINGMLQRCGEQYQCDRSYLVLFSQDEETSTSVHEWSAEGIETNAEVLQNITPESIPWLMQQFLTCSEVYISDVESLPSEAGPEKELFTKHGTISAFLFPVKNKETVLGFLGLETLQEFRFIPREDLEPIKIIANILADALIKVAAEKEIKALAFYDSLTGLPNRSLFIDRLRKEIYLAQRMERFIAVILIDLDNFKNINDTIGHYGGDELLKQVAQRLSQGVRKHDTVARFGGDEFLVMITNIRSPGDIVKIVDKLMKTFEHPISVSTQEFFITASAGIAVYPADGEDPETLIKNADLAMYASKAEGKNKWTLCTTDIKDDVVKRMNLINSLYRSLERNELELYYQPQVNVATNEIIGLEALIRWKHPDLGMIMPNEFIPLAEQTGLIGPIGEWVLRTACRQSVQWQKEGLPPVRMIVNLSLEQLRNPRLVDIVKGALSETGLKPEYLELEITESSDLIEKVDIANALTELKDLGVKITIDDFGTRYSSLSRLKALPVDRIKLDMEFVHGIAKDEKNEGIVKVIIQLSKNLNIDVIAEGVETEAQMEFLKGQGCLKLQGYYYYKPLPKEEVELLLMQQRNIINSSTSDSLP